MRLVVTLILNCLTPFIIKDLETFSSRSAYTSVVYSIPLIFSRGNPHGLYNCFHFVPWNSFHFWMMYKLLNSKFFSSLAFLQDFWQHTIVITSGYKAGLTSPPKQQWNCQNHFNWSAENSFLLNFLNLPSKSHYVCQKIPYLQPWHSDPKKTRFSTATAANISQGGNKENNFLKSWTREKTACPVMTRILLTHPLYQRLMAGNYVVQLNTPTHQCCCSKLPPYCFPIIKPRNVPAQVIRECNLGYTLKTLKHGKW